MLRVIAAIAFAAFISPAHAGIITDEFSFSGTTQIDNSGGVTYSTATLNGYMSFNTYGTSVAPYWVDITSVSNFPSNFFYPIDVNLVGEFNDEDQGGGIFNVSAAGAIDGGSFLAVDLFYGGQPPYLPTADVTLSFGDGFFCNCLSIEQGGSVYNLYDAPLTYTTVLDTFPQSVPEPLSLTMLATGLIGVAMARRKLKTNKLAD